LPAPAKNSVAPGRPDPPRLGRQSRSKREKLPSFLRSREAGLPWRLGKASHGRLARNRRRSPHHL